MAVRSITLQPALEAQAEAVTADSLDLDDVFEHEGYSSGGIGFSTAWRRACARLARNSG